MSKLPSVAIIIPAYNEEETIGRCLESCIAQSSKADEIIVVNNNSVDDTVKIVKKIQKDHPDQNIRLLHEKTQGITATRNHGFEEAKSEILGRIDADSTISSNWVETVRETFKEKGI